MSHAIDNPSPLQPGSAPIHGADPHNGSHHGDPHLAHHFDSVEQQTETGKLGMWVFLGTEVLMFGGLFCAYSVYRGNHPEVFEYAHTVLNKSLGGLNTVILLASSLTMAWGVRCAQLGKTKPLMICLALTFLGACGFMTIKTIEYTNKYREFVFIGPHNVFSSAEIKRPLTPEQWDREYHHHGAHPDGGAEAHNGPEGAMSSGVSEEHSGSPPSDAPAGVKPANGLQGTEGGGGGRSGSAAHVTGLPAAENPVDDTKGPGVVATTMKSGAAASEIASTQPAMASMPLLAGYADVFAGSTNAAKIQPHDCTPVGLSDSEITLIRDEALKGTPDTPWGPALTAAPYHDPTYSDLSELDRKRINTFFSIYFAMTGLHGVHVVVGMGLIAWIFFRAKRNEFGPKYFAPVDLVGLYWHLVDLIWIFLFPLLYLIH